jgi:hypothetical protein
VTPQILSATRRSDVTERLDPCVVAVVPGIAYDAALHHLTDAVPRENLAFGDTWKS